MIQITGRAEPVEYTEELFALQRELYGDRSCAKCGGRNLICGLCHDCGEDRIYVDEHGVLVIPISKGPARPPVTAATLEAIRNIGNGPPNLFKNGETQ